MKNLSQGYAGKRVLVTGAAGFIGSHLVDHLVALGAEVRALDNMSDGVLDNLAKSLDTIDFRQASITDRDAVDAAVEGCDFVFHLAANALVPRSSADPEYDFRANAVGTFEVLDAFRQAGSGRLIFTSSAAVYGEPQTDKMGEDHPLVPKSPYAATKITGEYLLDGFSRCYDLDHRRVRIFNTFGPRQRKYVMFDLLEKLRRDQKHLEVIGTGEQVRDYNYVADTVLAILLVGVHPEARGKVYNIAGGRPITIRALVDLIIRSVRIDTPEVTYTMQSWPGDVVRMVADCSHLDGLGYERTVSLEDGLANLIDWHREEYAPPW